MHNACSDAESLRPIHLLSDFITSPKIRPRFVLRSYRRLREPGPDLWLPITIMWFYHETWKLWLRFSLWGFWLCSRLGSKGQECESRGVHQGWKRSGAASEMEEIRIGAKRVFDARTRQPSFSGKRREGGGRLGTEGSRDSSFACSEALISTLAAYRPRVPLAVRRLRVGGRERRLPPRLPARGGSAVAALPAALLLDARGEPLLPAGVKSVGVCQGSIFSPSNTHCR